MNYILPKDLALKYNVSLKTIYNQLSKTGSKIRSTKQFWKTFISEKDFEEFYSKDLQNLQNLSEKDNSKKGFWNNWNDFEYLQKEYNLLANQKEQVSKYNLALQEQVSKYALLLNEEKEERKEIMAKYDTLQNDYLNKTIAHWKEKVKAAGKFYLLLWCTLVLLILSLLLIWQQYEASLRAK